jgi:NAD(P)-dependent dehydrogenase (short-subunit alcohol dehydrogenase family)
MPKALIIGASRGLGLGLVEEFAGRGWQVLATVRDPDSSSELNQLALGGKARIERLDVTDLASAERLRDLLADEDPFDLIFHNAGVGHPKGKTVLTASDDEAWTQFHVNAVGSARTAEALVGLARPGQGVVAFMTSRLGSVADKTSDHADLYSASKAALNSLTRSFVARHADKQLTVLSLHPGWVRTDLGGDGAPLEVEDSVRGLADIVEARRGAGGHVFLDYTGATLPW